MDFTKILNLATNNHNEALKTGFVKRYDTKVSAAKKLPRGNVLSKGIQDFINKKKLEEQKKAAEAMKKKEELLALRSAAKHNRKASAMARRTKDNNFAANFDHVPEEGGEKIRKEHDQKPNFSVEISCKTQIANNRNMCNRNEAKMSYNVKSKVNGNRGPVNLPKLASVEMKSQHTQNRLPPSQNSHHETSKKGNSVKKPSRPPPPPVDFASLLKIAKQKQYEPVVIPSERNVKNLKRERPMTQEEIDRTQEEAYRKNRSESRPESRPASFTIPKKNVPVNSSNSKINGTSSVQKVTGKSKSPKEQCASTSKPNLKTANKDVRKDSLKTEKSEKTVKGRQQNTVQKPVVTATNVSSKLTSQKQVPPRPSQNSTLKPASTRMEKPTKQDSLHQKVSQRAPAPMAQMSDKRRQDVRQPVRNGCSSNVRTPMQARKEFTPRKEFMPSKNLPVRKGFPPRDVIRDRMKVSRPPSRYRIESDEDDEEMDDFIDDTAPEDDEDDYSKHIREIFGYDRRKYTNDIDDDRLMESSFVQQMKEEAISARAGLMEDLEDVKREEEEYRRRNIKKRKLR